jgi:putative ABC transport system permease protein
VKWAVPLYKGLIRARLEHGTFQTFIVVGLDDTILIGGPPQMVAGQLADLRRSDSVVVDIAGASDNLAKPASVPGGEPVPLAINDTLALNDHRAIVISLARVTRTFQSQPIIYTTYARATIFASRAQAAVVRAGQGEAGGGPRRGRRAHPSGDRTGRLHA